MSDEALPVDGQAANLQPEGGPRPATGERVAWLRVTFGARLF